MCAALLGGIWCFATGMLFAPPLLWGQGDNFGVRLHSSPLRAYFLFSFLSGPMPRCLIVPQVKGVWRVLVSLILVHITCVRHEGGFGEPRTHNLVFASVSVRSYHH